MAYFRLMFQNSPGPTERNDERPQDSRDSKWVPPVNKLALPPEAKKELQEGREEGGYCHVFSEWGLDW
jgi:hypothetical protein